MNLIQVENQKSENFEMIVVFLLSFNQEMLLMVLKFIFESS